MHVFGYVRRHDFRLLKEAIQNGTVSVFEQALAAPNDLIGSSGWLELLTLAARVNQGEIVRLLANDDRVDVNDSLAYESPPLACAVRTEAHQSVASLLACERVNVNLLQTTIEQPSKIITMCCWIPTKFCKINGTTPFIDLNSYYT